jgi:hypothetical protein
VHVTCGKESGQITHRRDIERFAVSEERSYLAFLTSQITKRTATSADAVYTTTLVDLRSGKLSQTAGQAFGDNTLVGTCGGIFRAAADSNEHSGTIDLITGAKIDMPPYRWFICSSDRRVVFGSLGAHRGEGNLYEGIPPALKVPALAKYNLYTYNISPDGSKIAYETGSRPLCVLSSSGPPECAAESLGENFELSVNNAGEVLIEERDPKDGHIGIAYWKAGLESLEVIESYGDAPQWISPATAELLLKLSAQHDQKEAR